jgi:hypothetical protein
LLAHDTQPPPPAVAAKVNYWGILMTLRSHMHTQ